MSRHPPLSPTIESDEENGIHHLNGPRQQQSFSDISISSSRPHSPPTYSRSRSRNLSDGSLNSNGSEILDAVSELTPLVGNSRHAYEPLDDHHHAGLSDDESINTVTPLPGMIIKCHSISANSAAGRRGICLIRPSTAKVVSKYT